MPVVNHVGLVVAQTERSVRFYCEAFGFARWFEIRPGDAAVARLNGLSPPLAVRCTYLYLDGFVLELMEYTAPGAGSPFRERSMDEPGLTHLSISVPDVRTATARAAGLGGEVLPERDVGAALFLRDPDGQLLELLPSGYRDGLPPPPGAGDPPAGARVLGTSAPPPERGREHLGP